jgi:formylglycine-generating enzyme required for sulfatase activity
MVLVVCAAVLLPTVTAMAQWWNMGTVGNPGNPPDTRYDSKGVGAVQYVYQISFCELRTDEYANFLNAVAKEDPYGLYNTAMDIDNDTWGCNIKRSGSSGSYTYSVPLDWARRPVNYVSWGDAARFCNWLANGCPTGNQDLTTTEDGSYYLNGAMWEGLLGVTRKPGAVYVIPSEDEWYKAAYHKNDGVTGNYWDYPTRTNSTPSNVVTKPDPGNNANFNFAIGDPYYRTEMATFNYSYSPYQTVDQGGNVFEWTDTIKMIVQEDPFHYPPIWEEEFRVVRGGSFYSFVDWLHASADGALSAWGEGPEVGFRVAVAPEPATLSLLALGGLALIRRRRK